MQDARLKEEILARYASVHAFCKAHPELKRGVVYQTVSGKYAGNRQRQAGKILQALRDGPEADATPSKPEKIITRERLTELLENIRCANCRRLNRRECLACKAQTTVEASQLFDSLYSRD